MCAANSTNSMNSKPELHYTHKIGQIMTLCMDGREDSSVDDYYMDRDNTGHRDSDDRTAVTSSAAAAAAAGGGSSSSSPPDRPSRSSAREPALQSAPAVDAKDEKSTVRGRGVEIVSTLHSIVTKPDPDHGHKIGEIVQSSIAGSSEDVSEDASLAADERVRRRVDGGRRSAPADDISPKSDYAVIWSADDGTMSRSDRRRWTSPHVVGTSHCWSSRAEYFLPDEGHCDRLQRRPSWWKRTLNRMLKRNNAKRKPGRR